MKKEYFLGLNISKNGIGWCVTDTRYNILNVKNKPLIGIRLFEEGQNATERRLHRNTINLNLKRKKRLNILKNFFEEEISKVDKDFFLRMQESFFYSEDKKIDTKYILFDDENFNDKDYHKKYPTIYHLRKDLLESEDKKDIRLIYLAIHHIMKRRGHFNLKSDLTTSKGHFLENAFKQLNAHLDEENLLDLSSWDFPEKMEKLTELVYDENKSNRDKKKAFNSILNKNKPFVSLLMLTVGSKVNLSDLFNEDEYKGIDELSINLSEKSYEEIRPILNSMIGDKVILLDTINSIYENTLLRKIIGESKTISEAYVSIYESHKEDLRMLKDALKIDKEAYNKMFLEDEAKINNYVSYIGKHKENAKISNIDFYAYVKSVLNKVEDTEEKFTILHKIDKNTFMPKQKNTNNRVIPKQLHLQELKKILENAQKHYSFLMQVEDDLSIAEKIVKMFDFKMSFFVGSLRRNKKNAWCVKKSSEMVLAWNLDKVVDLQKTAENYIERMIGNCSYIEKEKVIPKNSLLYSEFVMRNNINMIRYEGKKISPEAKDALYMRCLKNSKNLTRLQIKKFLVENKFIKDGPGEITGLLDNSLNNSLGSVRAINKILGINYDRTTAEDIIKSITVFGDNKSLLKEKLRSFSLKEEQINELAKLNIDGWGNLSEKLLKDIRSGILVDSDGNELNIIQAMKKTGETLEGLMSSKYDFREKIEKINLSRTHKDTVKDFIDNTYATNAIKRSLRQTVSLLKEIRKIMKCEPKNVFIVSFIKETSDPIASTKGKKRYLMKAFNNDKKYFANSLEILNGLKIEKLRSKKIYLYLQQNGYCMYTGKKIEYSELFTDKYNIDHIYPKSKTNDNSNKNLVLVCKEDNLKKGDSQLVDKNIQRQMKPLWTKLLSSGAISSEKYKRLLRTEPYSDEDFKAFLQAEFNSVTYTSKLAKKLVEKIYDNSKVVFVKEDQIFDFNNNFSLYERIKQLNKFYLAKDAYIGIVYGNFINEKFLKKFYMFDTEEGEKLLKKYNLSPRKLFAYEYKVNDELIWDPKKDIITLRKNIAKKINVSYKTDEKTGEFYKQNPIKAKNSKNNLSYLPIKGSDERLKNVERYGSYQKPFSSYYTIVEYTILDNDRKDIEKRLIPTPIYLKGSKEDKLLDFSRRFLFENIGKEVEDIKFIGKLAPDTKVLIDGYPYITKGRTGQYITFKPFYPLDIKDERLAKTIKYAFKNKYFMKSLEEEDLNISHDDLDYAYFKLIELLKGKLYRDILKNPFESLEEDDIRLKYLSLDKKNKLSSLLNIISSVNDLSYEIPFAGIKTRKNNFSSTFKGIESFEIVNQSHTTLYDKKRKIK